LGYAKPRIKNLQISEGAANINSDTDGACGVSGVQGWHPSEKSAHDTWQPKRQTRSGQGQALSKAG
jgi:hypothetical protein